MRLFAIRAAGLAAALLTGPTQVVCGEAIFELQEHAPGIHDADVTRRPAGYPFARSRDAKGADGVLVVDTRQSSAVAHALIAEIGRLTNVQNSSGSSAPGAWGESTASRGYALGQEWCARSGMTTAESDTTMQAALARARLEQETR